eukprot:c24529_g1_i1 orf=552-2459(-)
MASWLNFLLSLFWPSKVSNDLSISNRLVHSLPLQPSTKYFTLALRDPQQPSNVLYILTTMLLSEQSASDARDLINTVKPGAVVVQVGFEPTEVMHMEHFHSLSLDIYPQSALHVIKESFHDGNIHAKYMKMAQADVIKAIFGTTMMGHVVAAKQAAAESKSSFYYLERPPESADSEESGDDKDELLGAARHVTSSLGSSLFFQLGAGSCKVNLDSPGLRFIASHVKSSLDYTLAAVPSSAGLPAQGQADANATAMEYECPEFAQPFYPFLAELYNTYRHLPGMGLALQRTQKLLMDVEKGKGVDHSELAVCQCFRLAAEGLRVALNSSARAPLKLEKVTSSMLEFNELPYEERFYVLLSQALKQQLMKSQSVVAVLDAHMVAGIRKYWMTPVPDHVAALAMECLISEAGEDASNDAEGSKGRILDIIVVGTGAAAAAVGMASFSHWAPASTAMKILSFKIPTIVKLGILQTKKGTVAAMAKAANPVVNLFVPSGKGVVAAKSTMASKVSVLKAVTSSGNVRAAAHSVIATAEKASLSAIRTAFYNAMRNRHRKGVGGRLWLSFGVSVAACAGLLTFGDGIENVIEIIPEAYTISRLCQGVRNLCHASNDLKKVEDARYWEAMYSRLHKEFKDPIR